MKNRLISFAYMLPVIELPFAAIIVIVPTLRLFTRLKLMANGSASVSLAFGEFVVNIPLDRFLSFAFDRAAWWAERPVTILNTPAKFVEPLASLIVAREIHWWPRSLREDVLQTSVARMPKNRT